MTNHNVVRTLVRAVPFLSLLATACADNGGDVVESVKSTSGVLDLSSVNVLTRSYDNLRSGANLSETVLTQANVNTSQFGKILQLPVDDEVYAQVLYASGVTIGGVAHHVIYVATVNNSVYAFDADSGGAPLWMKNYNGLGNPPNHTQVGVGGYCSGGYNDMAGKIGIVGTPVIDGNTSRMYFVTRHVVGTTFSQVLHAIDVTTGNDAVAAKTIAATVPGTGDGSSGGNVSFDPKQHHQRSALALAGGAVYIAWAGHCDFRPYHGWVMAYDATSLNQIGAFNATPNGTQGGIWMSGAGPIVDATGVYYNTGNGSGDLGGAQPGYGESVLKFSLGTVNVSTSFTAGDWGTLNAGDTDLGVSGMAGVPGTSFILTGSKSGKGYLLNSGNLGGLTSGDSQIPQVFQAIDKTARPSATHHIHSGPVMWNSPQGLNTYFWSENDYLRAFRFNTSTQTYNTPAALVGSILPPLGMPGGFMAISANGSTAGTGILWATAPTSGDANHATVAGTLRAFNAETLAVLWDSSSATNNMGSLAKYNSPLVANGSVYVASFENAVLSLSNEVSVYRNISTSEAPLGGTAWPIPGTIEAEKYDMGGANVAYFDTTAGNAGAQAGPAFRPNDVDIEVTTDTGGGFDVGWTAAGEWLKYTVNVQASGVYKLNLRLASAAAGSTMHVELDGTNISGTVAVPNTGGWQTWTTVSVTTPSLALGQHVMRVSFDAGGPNLNWVSFASTTGDAGAADGEAGVEAGAGGGAGDGEAGAGDDGAADGATADASDGEAGAGDDGAGDAAAGDDGAGDAGAVDAGDDGAGDAGAADAGDDGAADAEAGAADAEAGAADAEAGTGETPYGGMPWAVPGQIEAENYDNGGKNVAYFDTTPGNAGGKYRNDDVDIEATTDTGGGFDVGYTAAGEWLKYTVNVATAGVYKLNLRVASAAAGTNTIHAEMDGVNISGTVTIPNTGGWQTYTTVSVTTTSLSAGQHVVRVVLDTGGYNVNWISFATTGEGPYGGTPWAIPGKIEAENYDIGGQNVAYYDTTPGNTPGKYRTDDVDIETTADTGGGFDVGYVATGEWLKYTVNVQSSGTRTLTLRVATLNTGKTMHVEMDGANISGTVTIPNTGGWQTWATVSVTTSSLSAGQHVLRIFFDTDACNLNWINLQ